MVSAKYSNTDLVTLQTIHILTEAWDRGLAILEIREMHRHTVQSLMAPSWVQLM